MCSIAVTEINSEILGRNSQRNKHPLELRSRTKQALNETDPSELINITAGPNANNVQD